jgi:hypothetical protein
VSGGVDHDHDDQPEHEADPDRAERAVVLGVGDDRAAPGEHESERGKAFAGAVRSHPDEPIFLTFFRHQRFSARSPAAVMTF